MTNFLPWWKRPLALPAPRLLPDRRPLILTLALAMIGFIDAAYLAVYHFLGEVVPCALTSGCEAVTTSRFATIGPVPVAVLGVIYYGLILFLGAHLLHSRSRAVASWMALVVALGFVFSLYLIFLQATIINAFCFYCLVSATVSTCLFVVSFFLKRATL